LKVELEMVTLLVLPMATLMVLPKQADPIPKLGQLMASRFPLIVNKVAFPMLQMLIKQGLIINLQSKYS